MTTATRFIHVVDVESTCWPAQQTRPPEPPTSDIIEIGLVRVDVREFTMPNTYGQLTVPEHSEVSPFCTQLTTITPEMVDKKAPGIQRFPHALDDMRELYHIDRNPWASWGDYDRRQFEKCCKLYNCEYPFYRTHLNIKNLFALITGENECGVDQALKKLGMEFRGTAHRALDDAENIAKILIHLLRTSRVGLKTWAEYSGISI